jgi:hypothetical protein
MAFLLLGGSPPDPPGLASLGPSSYAPDLGLRFFMFMWSIIHGSGGGYPKKIDEWSSEGIVDPLCRPLSKPNQ